MKIQENIAREFDAFASEYTSDMIKCVPHYLSLIQGLVQFLPVGFTPNKILDLGCGNGNATEVMLGEFPGSVYTLVDASSEMIQMCQNRFKGLNVNFFEGYFDQFDFKPCEYDLTLASFSFHHLDARQKKHIFRKVYESLVPGGVIMISDLMINKNDPDHLKLVSAWKKFVTSNYSDQLKWQWLMEHYAAFDKPDHYDDHICWMLDAGFNEVDIPWQESYWTLVRGIKSSNPS